MRSFTPIDDPRTDDGPTGEFPVVDAAPSDPPLQATVSLAPATAGTVIVESMTPDDFDDRFIVEGEPVRRTDDETVVHASDVFGDDAPSVVVQRWARTSLDEIEAVLTRARARSAVAHPAVSAVRAVVRTPLEVGVVYARDCNMRLDRWVAEDGAFDRNAAIALVDRVVDAVDALRRGGLAGVPVTPDRIGLRWPNAGADPEPMIIELAPLADSADAVADLAGLLAFCLTGDSNGRVPGRGLRALVDAARDPTAPDRPTTLEAFRAALLAVTAERKASGARRGLMAAAVFMLAAGIGGGWALTRPEPVSDTRPEIALRLSATNDDAPPPPPLSEVTPLGEAHEKVSGRVATGLAALDTLRRRDRPKQARHLLEQLGGALDGRNPTDRDRASVASLAARSWYAADLGAARSATRAALDARDDDRLAPALARIYALDPTHVGAAFARRNGGNLHILEEHR